MSEFKFLNPRPDISDEGIKLLNQLDCGQTLDTQVDGLIGVGLIGADIDLVLQGDGRIPFEEIEARTERRINTVAQAATFILRRVHDPKEAGRLMKAPQDDLVGLSIIESLAGTKDDATDALSLILVMSFKMFTEEPQQ
jgi:hypothetical protein